MSSRRQRPRPGRLVLIKEDLDTFALRVNELVGALEQIRHTSVGVEIEQGDRGNLYLPRIRAVL